MRIPLSFRVLALCLLAASPPGIASATDLIPFGASWDYMHPTDGVDPAIADPDFDDTWFAGLAEFSAIYNGPAFGALPTVMGPPVDSGVGQAPIGYGSVTYINNTFGGFASTLTTPEDGLRFTAYFRHPFTVTEDVDYLALDIIADDAAVIYLDGERLAEVNFLGDDTYTAESIRGANENLLRTIAVDLGALSVGEHILAVSLHQTSPGSSDLGFDLRLSDEGAAAHTLAYADFGGSRQPVFVQNGIYAWQNIAAGEFLLNNGDGSTVVSEAVDLVGRTDVIFAMRLETEETSNSTNFEEDDRFSAKLKLVDEAGLPSELGLIPMALDTTGDGALTGSEFGPGKAPKAHAEIDRFLTARIPEGTKSARLSIEAINDSVTEEFTISDARFFEGVVMGTVDFGTPADLFFLQGPENWVEQQPGTFAINDVDGGVLVSDVVDVSAIRDAQINLDFNASETSTASNFESGDTFQAWLEVTDQRGSVSTIELLGGEIDSNGDNVLAGDEFAEGVDPGELVSLDLELVGFIPNRAISVQLFIEAENNSPSETFTISSILFTGVPSVPADFTILSVSRPEGGAAGWEISWESEPGVEYELQFSPDLSPGSYGRAGSITATGPVTSLVHAPGTPFGFYRVVEFIP